MTTHEFQDLEKFRVPPGFRGRNGFVVPLWQLVQATLFGLSPQPFYAWRRAAQLVELRQQLDEVEGGPLGSWALNCAAIKALEAKDMDRTLVLGIPASPADRPFR
jgi:hypothetical protein